MVAVQVPRVVALEVAIEVAAVVAQVSLEMSARLTVVVSEDNMRRRHNEMLSPVDLLEDHEHDDGDEESVYVATHDFCEP